MYINHYLEQQICSKKLWYKNLNLIPCKGKEAKYPELIEMVISGVQNDKKTLKKDLKLYTEQVYITEDFFSEKAANEVRVLVTKLFNRLYDYIVNRRYQILEVSNNYNIKNSLDETGLVFGRYDIVVKDPDGVVEVIKFQWTKPKYSYRGRKYDSKVVNSIELNSMLYMLHERYPDNEVKASILYLRNKEDKRNHFPDFEHKKGANIISLRLSEVMKRFKLNQDDLKKYFAFKIDEYLEQEREQDCKSCVYQKICRFEDSTQVTSPNIRLREQNDHKGENCKSIKLNTQQQSILNNLTGTTQVVAVPGAGKTRIIVEAIKKLVSQGVNPKSILTLTFTNKATSELRERLGDITDVKISNYNTFGYALVREFYQELGFEHPPRLITQFESFEVLRELIEVYNIPLKYEYLYHRTYGQMWEIYRAVNHAISKGMVRNVTMLPIEMLNYQKRFKLTEELLVYLPLITSAYLYTIRSRNLISFDQQIDLVNELFSKNKKVLHKLQSSYSYVFLDEYQDTNLKQHNMIMAFANKNVVMVGDEDQSIFGFRGSDPMNFLSFMSDGSSKFYLSKNYRSGSNIIRKANQLISQNRMRNDKVIAPARSFDGVYKEHRINGPDSVLSIVNNLIDKNIPLRDIAILTRKNKHIESLKDVLKQNGYRVKTNFNRLVEEADFLKFRALLNVISLRASREDEYLVMKHIYFEERIPREGSIVLQQFIDNTDCSSFIQEDLTMFSHLINNSERIDYMFYLVGAYGGNTHKYIKELYNQLFLINLEQLREVINGMVTIDEDVTVESEAEGVNLITAHGSKGLEFKAVIIYAVEEFGGSEEELEEERRLLYVAMTRAKDELHMTTISSNSKQVMNLEVA